MFSNSPFELWLCYVTLSGLVILSVGAFGVWLCKEPVHKIRIIQWAFLGCLIVPLVQTSGLMPLFELPVVASTSEVDGVTLPANAQAAESIHDTHLPVQPLQRLENGNAIGFANTAADNRRHAGSSSLATSATRSNSPAFPSIGSILKWAWTICFGAFISWWGVGCMLRFRIANNAQPATKEVQDLLLSIAGKDAAKVRLLTNKNINSPVMWGLFRPTIVIPSSHLNDPQALRWGLAHEWCHVLRRDFFTRILAMTTRLICFFQPCYWWLDRELAHNQDVLADAFASGQGHADQYASFLMKLSKQKNAQLVPVGLGIAERGSTMFRRIRTLLVSSTPPLRQSSRIAALIIAAFSIIVITGLGAVRLGAVEQDIEGATPEVVQQETKAKPLVKEDNEKVSSKPIVHTGVVVDGKTGFPIAGATVHVKRDLSRDPKTQKWVLLEQTEHKTNMLGLYSFSLTAEQAAESSLYLEIKTEHPDYQSTGWGGYSYNMIRTNLKKGDWPWFSKINLQPGEEIFATVTDPDGKPIPNVRVTNYSKETKASKDGRHFRGSFSRTKTDDNGDFRFIVPSPGDGVLWIFPQDYAPQAYLIGDKRGDFGTLKMKPGVKVTGKVLDAEGNPLPGVGVNLRREGDGGKVDEFLRKSSVANSIKGGTVTAENGTFVTKPLPAGTYRVEVKETVDDPTIEKGNWFDDRYKEKLKHVFAQQKIEVNENTTGPFIFKAVAHVTIRGQFLDGDGKPRASHSQRFLGWLDEDKGKYYSAESSRPGEDGKFEIRVPAGITKSHIQLTTNEHSSLRWRLAGQKELSYGDLIQLGTLTSDVDGLEIVRYKAPILIIKVEDPAGKPVRKFSIDSLYTNDKRKTGIMWGTGAVGFEKQTDGRWRSSQMLPDAEVSIKIMPKEDAEGSPLAEPQTVTLKEGESREIKFVVDETKVASAVN